MKRSAACLALAILGSGQLAPAQSTMYQAFMSGPNEFPANASPGIGSASFVYTPSAHTLMIGFDFSGLTGTSSAAHIHAPTSVAGSGTAGVATTTPYFAGFPVGVTSGTYTNTLDLTAASSWNASYITANGGTTAGAETALIGAFDSGKAYLNIHSSTFGGGEIRGFITVVPEPSILALAGLGAAALAWRARRLARGE